MPTPTETLYLLKPLLLALLLPPAPGLMLVALGGLWLRQRRLGPWLVVMGLLYAWFGCTEWLAGTLQRALLNPPPPLSSMQLVSLTKQADTAVLVLGGGSVAQAAEIEFAPDLSPLSLERLRYGIWLARRLQAPLGFSGGISPLGGRGRKPEAELAQRIASEEYGLRLHWAEAGSKDTRDNAKLSVPLLRSAGVKRVVLVTHVMHLPRALRAFEAQAQADLELIPAGVDYRPESGWTWSDFLPSSPGFRKNRYVWTEVLGLLMGH